MCVTFAGLFMDGVETILKEKRFQFKTPQATAAYQIASSLSKSKSSHILLINKFVTYLTKELKKCFVTTKRTLLQLIIKHDFYCGSRIDNAFKSLISYNGIMEMSRLPACKLA